MTENYSSIEWLDLDIIVYAYELLSTQYVVHTYTSQFTDYYQTKLAEIHSFHSLLVC